MEANQNEFSLHQFHIQENASVTCLEITERHHSHPLEVDVGKWNQEKNPIIAIISVIIIIFCCHSFN